jgi:hypothetical protein
VTAHTPFQFRAFVVRQYQRHLALHCTTTYSMGTVNLCLREGSETEQSAWRFCGKCAAMFFDGRPDKGTCPAGGGHSASGFTFVLPRDVPVKPLTLDLRANPDNLQINPELVIIGHSFTANGRFRYTVHNWPRVQDIHNQGAMDVNGSFERTESRGFASIRFGVDVPDIEVTAVDEATGRSITASVSAEKFIARFG